MTIDLCEKDLLRQCILKKGFDEKNDFLAMQLGVTRQAIGAAKRRSPVEARRTDLQPITVDPRDLRRWGPQGAVVRAVVREHGGPVTARQLCERTGWDKVTAYRWLKWEGIQ